MSGREGLPVEGLRRPPVLRAGSHVRIVALSGPVSKQRLARGTHLLTSLGLEVSHGAHVLSKHPSMPYLAGTDAERAGDLEQGWCDPAVDAVWAARGGYGAQRVLDLLDWTAMAAAGPKIFVGSSDLTAVLLAVATRLGLVTFHGPTAASQLLAGDEPDPQSLAGVRAALFEATEPTSPGLTAPGQTLIGESAISPGRATGITVGGNLSILASLAGSRDLVPARGAIALIEDVHEEPYRLDRLLTQLLRAGWFDGVAGIACGSWQDCGEPAAVRAVLQDRLLPLGVPVLDGLPFGHGPVQRTLPIGVPATLDADALTLTVRG